VVLSQVGSQRGSGEEPVLAIWNRLQEEIAKEKKCQREPRKDSCEGRLDVRETKNCRI